MVFMEHLAQYRNKYNFLLLIITLFVFACRQDRPKVAVDTVTKIPNIYLANTYKGLVLYQDTLWLKNAPYSGYIYELAPNKIDTVFFAGYLNGLLEGQQKKWHFNQQLWERRSYKLGKKNGVQQSFWENGNKRFEFIANEDICEGEMKEWAEDGLLVHLANFVQGQEAGTQKQWYSNGKIKSNYIIIKGKRYGLLGTKNCKNVSDSIFNIQ